MWGKKELLFVANRAHLVANRASGGDWHSRHEQAKRAVFCVSGLSGSVYPLHMACETGAWLASWPVSTAYHPLSWSPDRSAGWSACAKGRRDWRITLSQSHAAPESAACRSLGYPAHGGARFTGAGSLDARTRFSPCTACFFGNHPAEPCSTATGLYGARTSQKSARLARPLLYDRFAGPLQRERTWQAPARDNLRNISTGGMDVEEGTGQAIWRPVGIAPGTCPAAIPMRSSNRQVARYR